MRVSKAPDKGESFPFLSLDAAALAEIDRRVSLIIEDAIAGAVAPLLDTIDNLMREIKALRAGMEGNRHA